MPRGAHSPWGSLCSDSASRDIEYVVMARTVPHERGARHRVPHPSQSSGPSSAQLLEQVHVLVTTRYPRARGPPPRTPGAGRTPALEGVRGHRGAVTAAPDRLFLRGPQQLCAPAFRAAVLPDPQQVDVAQPAPGTALSPPISSPSASVTRTENSVSSAWPVASALKASRPSSSCLTSSGSCSPTVRAGPWPGAGFVTSLMAEYPHRRRAPRYRLSSPIH